MTIVEKSEETLVLEAPRHVAALVGHGIFAAIGVYMIGVGVNGIAAGQIMGAGLMIFGALFLGLPLYFTAMWGDGRTVSDATEQSITCHKQTLFGERQWRCAFREVAAVLVRYNEPYYVLRLHLYDGQIRWLAMSTLDQKSVTALAKEIEDWLAAHRKTAT